MATSEFKLSQYMRARLETWETNVSTENNTSIVHARIKVWRTNSWSGTTYSSSVRKVIVIDGTTVVDKTGSISHTVSQGEITVAEGQKTVTHNSDGSKSVGVSCSMTDNTSSYFSGSTSLTMGLTTIARASIPTLSKDTFNIGETITINTNRKSTSFTHTIDLTFGSYSYRVGTGITDSVSLDTSNIASSLYGQIPNANSGTGTITVTTYNGSTNIGSKSVSFTAKVTNSNPTFSDFSYADVNATTVALTGNNQLLIQGKSSLQLNISTSQKAVAKNSATMSHYMVACSNLSQRVSYSTSAISQTLGAVNSSGSQNMSVIAYDSRNNSTTVNKTITVIPYQAPQIFATATRLNNYEANTTIKIANTSGISPITVNNVRKNSVNVFKLRYKKSSDSAWSEQNISYTLGNDGKVTVSDFVISLDSNSAYDLQIVLEDAIMANTLSLTVSVGQPLFHIGIDGRVAVGGMPTEAKLSGKQGQLEIPNGSMFVKGATGEVGIELRRNDTSRSMFYGIGNVDNKAGLYDRNVGSWIIYDDKTKTYLPRFKVQADNIDWSLFAMTQTSEVNTVSPSNNIYTGDTYLCLRQNASGRLAFFSGSIGWWAKSGWSFNKTKIGNTSYYGEKTNLRLNYHPSSVVRIPACSIQWNWVPGGDPGHRIDGNGSYMAGIAIDTNGYIWVDVDTSSARSGSAWWRTGLKYSGVTIAL